MEASSLDINKSQSLGNKMPYITNVFFFWFYPNADISRYLIIFENQLNIILI